MSISIERLVELWQQTSGDTANAKAGVELRQHMDDELDEGRLAPTLLEVCARLPGDEGLDLWHLGQGLAEGADRVDDTGRRSLRLAFLSGGGYVEALDAWAESGTFQQGLRAFVDLHCDAVGLEPAEARVQCCPVCFHPEALAKANPDELRSLLFLLRNEATRDEIENHPTVIRHRLLEASDPLRGTAVHSQISGARIFVAAVDVPDEVAYGKEGKDDGLFERLIPIDTPSPISWKEVRQAHGGVDDGAMEVLAPVALASALFESLHNHILLCWAIDLSDRGGEDEDGRVLSFPEDAGDFIVHVDIVPTDRHTVMVEADSTLGSLVPVEIPLAWATATGVNGLNDCVDNLLEGLFPGEPTDHAQAEDGHFEDEEPVPFERPAPRRLH